MSAPNPPDLSLCLETHFESDAWLPEPQSPTMQRITRVTVDASSVSVSSCYHWHHLCPVGRFSVFVARSDITVLLRNFFAHRLIECLPKIMRQPHCSLMVCIPKPALKVTMPSFWNVVPSTPIWNISSWKVNWPVAILQCHSLSK